MKEALIYDMAIDLAPRDFFYSRIPYELANSTGSLIVRHPVNCRVITYDALPLAALKSPTSEESFTEPPL